MKKALSLILALAMVFALVLTVSADETTYTITINNETNGHTYEAYQIFAGDLATETTDNETTTILSNIVWGADVTSAGQTALGDASVKAESIKTDTDAKAFAIEIANYIDTEPTGTTNTLTDGKYTITGLAPGYYLVKDKDDTLDGDNDSYTSYILQVVDNVSVSPKSDLPSVQKKVKDINDSTETVYTDWQDSADHDIGDTVNFQLKATLPSNLTSYESYKVIFHDTLSAGLTYGDIVSVKVGDTNVDAYDATNAPDGYTVTTSTDSNGNAILTFTINDVRTYNAINSGTVTIEYTATLNKNAVIGSVGNPNEVYLEYSNNPNQTDEVLKTEELDTGETVEDKVIVFTYKTEINKVDENNAPLTGASFTLKKWNETSDTWVAVDEYTADDSDTTFTFVGIDDGRYMIEETATPTGYNSVDPIYFTVSATHDETADAPTLKTLTATSSDSTGTALETNAFTGDVSTGKVSTTVINQKGAGLPETGGIGTTIFYIVGGLLMFGAVVVLVARKRSSVED